MTTPDDIVGSASRKDREELQVQLTIEQARVLDILSKEESMHFSDLLQDIGLSIAELSSLLSEMEIYGLVNKLSGNYYQVARKL